MCFPEYDGKFHHETKKKHFEAPPPLFFPKNLKLNVLRCADLFSFRPQHLRGCRELHQGAVLGPEHAPRRQRDLLSHDLRHRHRERQVCVWRRNWHHHQRKPERLWSLLRATLRHPAKVGKCCTERSWRFSLQSSRATSHFLSLLQADVSVHKSLPKKQTEEWRRKRPLQNNQSSNLLKGEN